MNPLSSTDPIKDIDLVATLPGFTDGYAVRSAIGGWPGWSCFRSCFFAAPLIQSFALALSSEE
ncbi:hypothetical protein [Bradyrhizobium sp. Ash2021]|uniref:hypothetical protein n=1 Tax=Bradyrhizobium sp. Ash2021 TaxID=2954771 RepID=UPI002815DBD0|nr:hypothetical protein [Bradyrhizobium sp. Ash2021]WMT76471.1 hypothetical protein NL528_08955 [Bradyrhizobium sp. Ash2021]